MALPDAVIIAFIDPGQRPGLGQGQPGGAVDVSDGPPGFVVDGRQRLTALSGLNKPGFQVFVSALVCKNYDELRQQFVLINNTRPLPKSLIYELLPSVDGLPERYTARRFCRQGRRAPELHRWAGLARRIRQHTNPRERDQRYCDAETSHELCVPWSLEEYVRFEDPGRSSSLIDQRIFRSRGRRFRWGMGWYDPTGIASAAWCWHRGHGVRDGSLSGASKRHDQAEFRPALEVLKPFTAWTSGCGTWTTTKLLGTPFRTLR